MAKTSNTYDCAGASGFDVPLEGGIDSDACTEDGGNLVETVVKSRGDLEGPVVINLHVGAVASEILSVKVYTLLAHVGLLLFVRAVSAGVVRVADWTHPHVVSHLEVLHLGPHHCDLPDHLVANARWVRNFT